MAVRAVLALLIAVCQWPISASAVIGGTEAPPHTYPWLVRVEHTVFKNENIASHRLNPNESWTMQCGGALIDERWVLTAAHCIEEAGWGNKNMPLGLRVVLGDHVNDPSGKEEADVQIVPVSELVVHPQYAPDVNDLVLLRLFAPVAFSPRIAPISLAAAGDVRVGSVLTLAGWGQPEDGKAPSPVVRHASGTALAVSRQHISSSGTMLSGHGDSGGPVMVRADGRLKLAGVVSTRNGSSLVPAYLAWIESVLAETRQGASGDAPARWLAGGYGRQPVQAQTIVGNRTYEFRCDHGDTREFARCWTRVTERSARGAELRTPWMGRTMLQGRAREANLAFENLALSNIYIERRGNAIVQAWTSSGDPSAFRAAGIEHGNQIGDFGSWVVLDRATSRALFSLFGVRIDPCLLANSNRSSCPRRRRNTGANRSASAS